MFLGEAEARAAAGLPRRPTRVIRAPEATPRVLTRLRPKRERSEGTRIFSTTLLSSRGNISKDTTLSPHWPDPCHMAASRPIAGKDGAD